MSILFIILALIVNIIIFILVKYKEEIWYLIYQRMGWLEDDWEILFTKNKNYDIIKLIIKGGKYGKISFN